MKCHFTLRQVWLLWVAVVPLYMLTGVFAGDAAQPTVVINDRIYCEFVVNGTDYQLVEMPGYTDSLMGVYGNGKLLFYTPYTSVKLWNDDEYAAFRAQPYDGHWLNKFVRDLQKVSMHHALHPVPPRNPHEHISTPILPGMLLAPVVAPILIPLDYAHDAREEAFAAGWNKLAIGTDIKTAREMLGKPESISTNAASTYEVWSLRDNTGAGFANGKLAWKNTSYGRTDYGTGTHTGRW